MVNLQKYVSEKFCTYLHGKLF